MYKRFFKHLLDFTLTIIGLIAISPLLLIIMLLLAIVNDGRIFFIQERTGKNEEIFRLLKFITMNDKTDKEGKLLPDKKRLTKVGAFLRNISLDELPQLMNVLRGDMSFVGPRPLLTEYLSLYSPQQLRRQEVRPGVTGWAQVNGRNSISWEEKFEMDVWYVDNISFLLDAKIIILTLLKVLKREGINSSSSATMTKFTGSKL